MAEIEYRNFSLEHLATFSPQPNDIYINCNFTQKHPHTVITVVDGLTFQDCNLVNCDTPVSAILVDCNATQISRCGNLNADYTCEVNCSHVIDTDELEIDGVVVETIYHYANTRVG